MIRPNTSAPAAHKLLSKTLQQVIPILRTTYGTIEFTGLGKLFAQIVA